MAMAVECGRCGAGLVGPHMVLTLGVAADPPPAGGSGSTPLCHACTIAICRLLSQFHRETTAPRWVPGTN
jgi:hypothetical protein